MTHTERPRKSDFSADDSHQISFASELARKGTHLGSVIIPWIYYAFALSKGQALAILVPIALLNTAIEISRLRRWRLWFAIEGVAGKMVRKHEEAGDFTGAFYQLWMFVLVIALFRMEIAVLASSFIIVGDTFAALIGRRWGRHRFRGKSLEGSLAFLASALVVVFVSEALFQFPFSVALAGAVVATLVEAIPDFVDDNLSVPLISGAVMHYMMIFSG